MNNVKDSEFYAISFDKSLNPVIQMGQMDLLVNFWDNVVNKVCTHYLDSAFIGHALGLFLRITQLSDRK